MARVLLLNPPCRGRPKLRDLSCGESTKADYYWAPGDLVTLSGVLDGAHEVHVVDAAVEGLTPAAALDRCAAIRPDAVFTLTAAVTLAEDEAFLAALRARTGAAVWAMGDVASFLPAVALDRAPSVDGLVHNFAEPDLVRLADDPTAVVAGVVRRDAGPGGAPPPRIHDPLVIPRPRHDRFPLRRYRMPFTHHRGVATVLTATGCPFRCRFCASHCLPLQRRPVADVVDELAAIRALGVREVYLRDMTFGPSRRRARALVAAMVDARLGLRWSAECRLDVLDEALLEGMARAGCEVILVGVETGSPALAERLGKSSDHARTARLLRHARRHGVRSCGHFILGVPGETQAELDETARIARTLPLDYASFNLYAARPGSRWWEELVAAGRLDPADPGVQDVSLRAASHAAVDGEALRRHFRRAVLSFYFRPTQLARLLRRTPLRTLLRQGVGVLRLLGESRPVAAAEGGGAPGRETGGTGAGRT